LIAVSIVSHGHGDMVARLVGQLLAFPEVAQIILTLNVPESVALPDDARLTVIGNVEPKGFGANHNAAFVHCTQTFFCPLNPDIEFDRNPFPVLSAALTDDRVALVAPLVKSPDGKIEDSMRRFPTPASLLMKALGGSDGRYVVCEGQANFAPEWVAGMFMLFRSRDFHDLGGFDERFFLYYEDVDICVRVVAEGDEDTGVPEGERHSRCAARQSS
jgi:N-acetylglucosaminyl-diphospho-decaprenol L-rhamnosyltransferase